MIRGRTRTTLYDSGNNNTLSVFVGTVGALGLDVLDSYPSTNLWYTPDAFDEATDCWVKWLEIARYTMKNSSGFLELLHNPSNSKPLQWGELQLA
jgi:hypothetical protein